MAAKRRRGISLVALPFIALVWVVGWLLYCLGSFGQRLSGSRRKTLLNVPIALNARVSVTSSPFGSSGPVCVSGLSDS
jgi:hypothetical protein